MYKMYRYLKQVNRFNAENFALTNSFHKNFGKSINTRISLGKNNNFNLNPLNGKNFLRIGQIINLTKFNFSSIKEELNEGDVYLIANFRI